MATLKFYARKDHTVNARPGETLPTGQQMPLVGRVNDGQAWPAAKQAHEIDSTSALGRYVIRLMAKRTGQKDPPLWPADKDTAAACGHTFQPVEWDEGEWVPASKAPRKPRTVAAAGKAAE